MTGAIHARRALACFRKVGLSPDLLPVRAEGVHVPTSLWPRDDALAASTAVLHEVLGYVAYRLAGYAE